MGAVTLAVTPRAPFYRQHAGRKPSRQASRRPDREGRRNPEDGGVRDGGGERYGEEQAYGVSRDTNHALTAPTRAGWALGPSRQGNQSRPTCF